MRSLMANLYLGHHLMSRYLEDHSEATHLSALDAIVLAAIVRARRTTAYDLRSALHQPASTTSGVIRRLERHGYVRRDAPGMDRRYVVVAPTTVGTVAASMVASTVVEFDRRLLATVPPASLVVLERIVDEIGRLSDSRRWDFESIWTAQDPRSGDEAGGTPELWSGAPGFD